jgi:hypothetical protein
MGNEKMGKINIFIFIFPFQDKINTVRFFNVNHRIPHKYIHNNLSSTSFIKKERINGKLEFLAYF